jgi:small subunit ribosomal protein S17
MSEELKTENTEEKRQKRVRTATVLSDKMDKTIVVTLERRYKHPKFHKYVGKRIKFKAHDERNEAEIGDVVEVVESRPLSRDKRWRLRRVVSKHVG